LPFPLSIPFPVAVPLVVAAVAGPRIACRERRRSLRIFPPWCQTEIPQM
jgi:hypothetical protein